MSVGLFSAVTTALGNIAATLPPYAEIALIAYDDAVHFFSFGDTGIVQLTAPDANEACLPLPPSRLLFSLGESLDSFEELPDHMRKLVEEEYELFKAPPMDMEEVERLEDEMQAKLAHSKVSVR